MQIGRYVYRTHPHILTLKTHKRQLTSPQSLSLFTDPDVVKALAAICVTSADVGWNICTNAVFVALCPQPGEFCLNNIHQFITKHPPIF